MRLECETAAACEQLVRLQTDMINTGVEIVLVAIAVFLVVSIVASVAVALYPAYQADPGEKHRGYTRWKIQLPFTKTAMADFDCLMEYTEVLLVEETSEISLTEVEGL